jgi:hypothetical protein
MVTTNIINLNQSGIAKYDGAGSFSVLPDPLPVANSGTGASSFTAYGLLVGGTTSTNPVQSVVSIGNSGEVLKSNGTASLPTFQAWSDVAINVAYYGTTLSGNPADSSTYYLGTLAALTSYTTSVCNSRFYMGVSGTINICYGAFSVAGTLGTTENVTIALRKNDTSNTNISTTLHLSTSSVSFSATNLALSVTAGDFIDFIFIGPAWVTNPTTVSCTFTFLVN